MTAGLCDCVTFTRRYDYFDVDKIYYVYDLTRYGAFSLFYSGAAKLDGESEVYLKVVYKIQPSEVRPGGDGPNITFMDNPHPEDEFRMHEKVTGHENIIELLSCFDLDSCNVLVLDRCDPDDQSLKHYMEERSLRGVTTPDGIIRTILSQLLDAVEYCHKCGVFHCDIRPQNTLIFCGFDVKLAGFGLATDDQQISERRGTSYFISPEAYVASSETLFKGKTADIWSLGMTIAEFLTGRRLWKYPDPNNDCMYSYYLKLRAEEKEGYLYGKLDVSRPIASLLKRILDPDPDARPSIEEIRTTTMDVDYFTDPSEVLYEAFAHMDQLY